jgi:hypothetical protein
MHALDPHRDSTPAQRIADLEARVGWLEAVVAQLLGEPPSRHAPVSLTPRSAPVPAETRLSLARTQPLSKVIAPRTPEPAAPTESMSTLLDNMGITAAFASLDAKVEAASVEECLMAPIRLSSAPVLEIDPDLLDRDLRHAAAEKLEVHAVLEDQHPSILQRITASWRTPEARAYLHKLLVDDRGDRNGFDPGVISELLLLSSILEEPRAGAHAI